MNTLTRGAAVAVLTTQLLAPIGLEAQPAYTVTDIGSFGGDSIAWAVNDRGQVVGWSTVLGAGFVEGYFWSPETGMVGLGQVPDLTDTYALGLSDDGTVTGDAGRAFEDSRSFTWTLDGGLVPLPLIGTEMSASDINDSGQVTGTTAVGFSGENPYLFEDGVTTDLGAPIGSDFSTGDSINNLGEVLVNADTGIFILRDGQFVEQQSLGGFSLGDMVNDLGQVTGSSRTAGAELRAVLWTDGIPVNLGVFDDSDPGAFSSGNGLNERGTVIGETFPGPNGDRDFICEDGCPDGLVILDSLIPANVDLAGVFAINNAGQIVGRASIDGGFVTSVLLTPINPHPVLINPEPGVAGSTSDLDLLHFEPLSEPTLLFSLETGSTPVPGCGLELNIANPRPLASTTIDADGSGSFEIFVPSVATDRVGFFQAVDRENCEATAITAHRF